MSPGSRFGEHDFRKHIMQHQLLKLGFRNKTSFCKLLTKNMTMKLTMKLKTCMKSIQLKIKGYYSDIYSC